VAVLGRSPREEEVIEFIKTNYDMSDEYDTNLVGDIIGFYKIDPKEHFDADGNMSSTKNSLGNYGEGHNILVNVSQRYL